MSLLSLASIDSDVANARFMDEFTVVGGKPKPGAPAPSPCSPVAVLTATDRGGKQYCKFFEWLAMYEPDYVTACLCCSLKGNFYCTICNGKKKHHPVKCPLLGELGLILIDVSGGGHGGTLGSSLGSPPLAGAPCRPKPGTPPTARPAAVVPPSAPTLGSLSALAGLTVTVEENITGDESSTDSF